MAHDIESQEWLDALSSLVKQAGKQRASEILQQLSEQLPPRNLLVKKLHKSKKKFNFYLDLFYNVLILYCTERYTCPKSILAI